MSRRIAATQCWCAARVAGWAAPGVLLAVIPKCPLCLAAHVALWSGIGLSAGTASLLRTSMVWMCVGLLVVLGAAEMYGLLVRRGAARANISTSQAASRSL